MGIDQPAFSTPDQIFERYGGLVIKLAKGIAEQLPRGLTFGLRDLVQEGVIGLLDSVDKFDESRGVPFEAYARTRINGAMLDFLRREDLLARGERAKINRHNWIIQRHRNGSVHPITTTDYALHAGIDESEASKLLCKYGTDIVLGEGKANQGTEEHGMTLVDSPEESMTRREAVDFMMSQIECLPDRSQRMLTEYYWEDRGMKEIGEALGTTESNVSRVLKQIRGKLRMKLTRHFEGA